MNAEELEKHSKAFVRAYNAVNPDAPEDFKVRWAERVANSIALQYILSPGPAYWPHPYAAEDYITDVGSK